MPSPQEFDIAVIGGGIVGLATARSLVSDGSLSVVLLEAEEHPAMHQSGRNSGVIHSGLYYRPGSWKARLCVDGRKELERYCQEREIAFERCGKLVVATTEDELPALDELELRGQANGLQGLKRLRSEELAEIEPHVNGVAGLHVPETGIVDYKEVAGCLVEDLRAAGARVELGASVEGCRRDGSSRILETSKGEFSCRLLINCAGLQSDRVARLCGSEPGLRIVPFRGEYYVLAEDRRHLVKGLIYPVPDPRFPFLGVHFTRTIHGEVEAGPNAVLALRREGYSALSVSPRDVWGTFSYGGFWRLAASYWQTGMGEVYRSLSKGASVRALQKLLPEIEAGDLRVGDCGVRAQAVEPDGSLVDDFRFVDGEGMIHVLNAPSPAATASLRIGATIAERARKRL